MSLLSSLFLYTQPILSHEQAWYSINVLGQLSAKLLCLWHGGSQTLSLSRVRLETDLQARSHGDTVCLPSHSDALVPDHRHVRHLSQIPASFDALFPHALHNRGLIEEPVVSDVYESVLCAAEEPTAAAVQQGSAAYPDVHGYVRI